MASRLFTDPVDALGKVAGGLRAIVDLPKAEPRVDAPESGLDLSAGRYDAQHAAPRTASLK